MPIPQPRGGESEQAFVSRCMGDEVMRNDYSDQKQRAAVCYRTFSDSKKAAAEGAPMRFHIPFHKIDAEQRMVWGYASTETQDDQGEVVRKDAIAAALPAYMKLGNIREMHQLSAVGKAKEAAVDDKGLMLGAKIVDPVAWEKVKEGVYSGFSIGGRVTSREAGSSHIINGLQLNEISLVDRPANPDAIFDVWKVGETEMADGGLGTLGDVLQEAIAKQSPVQIWACNDGSHRHTKKEDAQRCMAKVAGAPSEAERIIAEARDQIARAEATLKATPPPQRDSRVDQNVDGDKDEDDGYGPGSGKPGDDVDRDKAAKAESGDYGDVTYADPGYQDDKKPRYPIDTEEHVRAAWSYINQEGNAGKYSSEHLASIKSKIRAAAKRHGIEIADKTGGVDNDVEKARRSHTDQGLLNLAYASSMAGANSPMASKAMAEEFGKAAESFEKAGARGMPSDYSEANPDTQAADQSRANPDSGLPTSSGGNDEATQHTQSNAETSAMRSEAKGNSFTPGDNATQDTSKSVIDQIVEVLGKRGGCDHFANVAHDCAEKLTAGGVCGDSSKAGSKWSGETMGHLRKAHDHLMRAGAMCKTAQQAMMHPAMKSAEESNVTQDEFTKALAAEKIEKSELIKTVSGLATMVEKLSARVEDIAKQPLPALTARPVEGLREVSKVDDGRTVDHDAPVNKGPSIDEAMKAWNEMSPEQRTLLSIQASYLRPYAQKR